MKLILTILLFSTIIFTLSRISHAQVPAKEEFEKCARGCFEELKPCVAKFKHLFYYYTRERMNILKHLGNCCGLPKGWEDKPADFNFHTCVLKTCKGKLIGCKMVGSHSGPLPRRIHKAEVDPDEGSDDEA